MKDKISLWVLIPSYCFALMAIGVGLLTYFLPTENFVPGIDTSVTGVSYFVFMFAARQVVIGTLFAYATFKRSEAMLTLLLSGYILLQLQDALIGVVLKDSGLSMSALVVGGIASIVLFILKKKKTA